MSGLRKCSAEMSIFTRQTRRRMSLVTHSAHRGCRDPRGSIPVVCLLLTRVAGADSTAVHVHLHREERQNARAPGRRMRTQVRPVDLGNVPAERPGDPWVFDDVVRIVVEVMMAMCGRRSGLTW